MNKYYIGYPLPDDLTKVIHGLYLQIQGQAVFQPVEQLHITALYLGAVARSDAELIFQSLGRRTLPILAELDTYQRFGSDSLVVTLKPNPSLTEFHLELSRLAGKPSSATSYNPHITVAKGRKAFIKIGCPEKAFSISSIALFEKVEGGEYEAHMVTRFQ